MCIRDRLPINGEGDGPVRDLAAETRFPQHLTRPRVEGVEVALAAASEQQIAGGRQDATIAHVELLELPLVHPADRIDRDHRRVPRGIRPVVDGCRPANAHTWRSRHRQQLPAATATKDTPWHVILELPSVDRRVVLPCGHVEEPGARAERWRVPVGAALVAGPRCLLYTSDAADERSS